VTFGESSSVVPIALSTLLFFIGGASAHAAEERPVVFSLSIDDSPLNRCGGEEALSAAVEERLHRSVFTGEDASDITIAVTSEGAQDPDPTWRAQIVAKDRTGAELGRREVPLPRNDCPKAIDTLAVVLAIMIGPARTTTDPPWQAEREPAAEPVVPLAPPPERPKPPKRRPSPAVEPLRWELSPMAGVVGGTGILPGAAFGAEAGVVVRPPVRRVAMIARAAYWFEVTTPTLPPADVDRIALALLGCYELMRNAGFGVLGCAGGEVSRIAARSTDLTTPAESSIVAAVLGEVRLGYRLPLTKQVFIEPYVAPQASVLLRRDQFTYWDPSGRERTLLFPAPAAFQASFGVAVHFL
jgi:hypothetical protein